MTIQGYRKNLNYVLKVNKQRNQSQLLSDKSIQRSNLELYKFKFSTTVIHVKFCNACVPNAQKHYVVNCRSKLWVPGSRPKASQKSKPSNEGCQSLDIFLILIISHFPRPYFYFMLLFIECTPTHTYYI
jgi:hypothetical protein